MTELRQEIARAIVETWAKCEESDLTWEELCGGADKPEEFPKLAKMHSTALAEADAILALPLISKAEQRGDDTGWSYNMSECPRDWSRPVYLAWWRDGKRALSGKKVRFEGPAHWYSDPDHPGNGAWHPRAEGVGTVEDWQAYAWREIPLAPPLPPMEGK